MISASSAGHYEHDEAMDRIYRTVRDSAYEIIERKGATYYGVAMAGEPDRGEHYPQRAFRAPGFQSVEGEYGLTDLCISVPTIVSAKGAEQVLEIPLSQEEKEKLQKSAAELKKVLDSAI